MSPRNRANSGLQLRMHPEADQQAHRKPQRLHNACPGVPPSSAPATVWCCGSVHLLPSRRPCGASLPYGVGPCSKVPWGWHRAGIPRP